MLTKSKKSRIHISKSGFSILGNSDGENLCFNKRSRIKRHIEEINLWCPESPSFVSLNRFGMPDFNENPTQLSKYNEPLSHRTEEVNPCINYQDITEVRMDYMLAENDPCWFDGMEKW